MTYDVFWLIASGVCLIGEIFTVSFLLSFPGVGAFLAFLAALLGFNLLVQILVFVISTTLLILFVRPLVAKFFKSNNIATNTNALIGKKGTVLKDINGSEEIGQVKVTGEIWSAICDEGTKIAKDTTIIVTGISGVKLQVKEDK